jgi:photosystem II stability/assembly factor-like uncharacterized protein
VALLSTGLLAWQSLKPRTAATGPAKGIEMFGRVDSKVAWAESGSDLYVTRDGGVTWSQGTVPGGRSLGQMQADMQAGNPQPAPAAVSSVAEAGATLAPGGDTPVQASPYIYFPNHLYPTFIDADHGWLLSWTVPNTSQPSAAANTLTGDWTLTVHRTSDSGKTWESTQLPGTYKGYGLVQFADAQHGWVTVYRLDYAMASSGTVSGPEPMPSPTPPPAMPSDATTVLATSDGGATWSRISTIPALALLRFTSASEAWGYTQTGNGQAMNSMVHSTDSGRTWQLTTLPLPDGYTMVATAEVPTRTDASSLILRVTCTHAYIDLPSGSNSYPYAIVTFLSGDDGRTWTLNSTNSADISVMNSGMSAVLQLPLGQPIAGYGGPMPDQARASGFKASFDGGATWIEYQTAGLPSSVSMAEWVSPDDVWAMAGSSGYSNGTLGGQLYATHDQGKTWTALLGAPTWPASPAPVATPILVAQGTAQAVGPSGPTITSSGRVDAKVGWVVVSDSTGNYDVRVTQDGGATWSEPRAMPNGGDVQFIDADHGWMLTSDMGGSGAAGSFSVVVLRTVDGGRTWDKPAGMDLATVPDTSQKFFSSTSVHFRDALHGELFVSFGSSSDDPAAGRSASPAAAPVCEQLSTSDGGATWSKPKSAPCMMMTGFADATLGYGTDPQGTPLMRLTVDGGQTWIDANLPLPEGVSAASASGAMVQLLERRADGTLRAMVAWMNGQTLTTTVVSADDGKTWTTAGVAQGLTGPAYTVASLGEGHWLALGQLISSGATAFALDARVTDDGGVTWKSIAAEGLPPYATSPHFVSATDGWVAAARPICDVSSTDKQGCSLALWALYATSDGGNTWRQIFTP